MAEIELTRSTLIIHLKGLNKLSASSSDVPLKIPLAHITSVNVGPDEPPTPDSLGQQWFFGKQWSWSGTIGKGGVHIERENKFVEASLDWRKVIVIYLTNESYTKLVLGVNDPAATAARIERAIANLNAPDAAFLQKTSISQPSGTLLCTYKGHSAVVCSIAWSPDSTRLASASDDKTVQVWNARTGEGLLTYTGHSDIVTSITWSPDGTRLASASWDRTVQVWDARTGQHLLTYTGHSKAGRSVAWSPDGTRIASGGDKERTAQIWDTQTSQHLFTYAGHDEGHYPTEQYYPTVGSVAWSPDGTRIASGSDSKGHVWDARTGQTLFTYDGFHGTHGSVAWSLDGTRLASTSWSSAYVWDAQTGQRLLTYANPGYIWTLTWSPNGTRLASAGNYKTVQVWDARTGQHLLTYTGHSDVVYSVAWSPDGTRLASAGGDKTVQVWDVS